MRKNIVLALLNIKRNNVRTNVVILILCAGLVLMMQTISISEGFFRICNGYKTNDYLLRTVYVLVPYGEKVNNNLMELIGHEEHVEYCTQQIYAMLKSGFIYNVGGTELRSEHIINGFNQSFSSFTYSMINERNGYTFIDPIKYGRDFVRDDKKSAIIDENLCYLLRPDYPESLIGEEISIHIGGLNIENIKIVGIYAKEMGSGLDYSTSSKRSRRLALESTLTNYVYYSDDVIEMLADSGEAEEWGYAALNCIIDNTDYVHGFCEKVNKIYDCETVNKISDIEKMAESVRKIGFFAYVVSVLIISVSLMCAMNCIAIDIQRQKAFFVLLVKIGYKWSDAVHVYVIQNMAVSIIAGTLALLIAFGTSIVIDYFTLPFYEEIYDNGRYAMVLRISDIWGSLLLVLFVIVFLSGFVSYIQMKGYLKRIHEK